MIKGFLVSVVCFSVFGFQESPKILRIPLSGSETLKIPGLQKVAIANKELAKVRALENGVLLITAKKSGITTLRVWKINGLEEVYELHLVPRVLIPKGDPKDSVVHVVVEFYEISSKGGEKFGIKLPDTFTLLSQAGVMNGGFQYSANMGLSPMTLQAMVRDGVAKILAKPNLSVVLGEEAVFHSGGELPIPKASEISLVKVQRNVEWKPYGMSVRIRPQSASSLRIGSEIKVEMSEVQNYQSIEGIPSLSQRKVHTKIVSEDGETVLISGLQRQLQSNIEEGAFLNRIPILGPIFGVKEKSQETSELLVALTLSFATRSKERESIEQMHERLHGLDS